MAKNGNAPPERPDGDEKMETIEALAEKHQIPPWTLAGAKAAYGWGEGKELTDAEFLKKVRTWLNGPMGGGER